MRCALVFLAACAWSVPAEPQPVPPAPRVAHNKLVPAGMYVSDLLSHFIGGDAPRAFTRTTQGCVDEVCVRPVVMRRATFVAGPTLAPTPIARALAAPTDTTTTIELCIDETGAVTSARASGGAAADAAAERARSWRFAPYFVRGKPMAVCSFVRVGDPPEPDGDDE